jgi:hypothetical protein
LSYAKRGQFFLDFLCAVNIKTAKKMETFISEMPLWAILLFVVSFILSLGFIARPARQAALHSGLTVEKSRRIGAGIILFYVLWLGYASVLSLKGVFSVNALPPRIFLFTTLPLFILLFGFVGNTGLFKRLLRSASLESLIYLHVFRVLGIFFFMLYWYRLLDLRFAISAGLGDIITAILAVPVARAVAQKKPWSIKAAYVWNILGILDIVTLMTIAVVNAIKSSRGESEMTLFPFAWFPAFAPATILFLHVAVFRKLRQK